MKTCLLCRAVALFGLGALSAPAAVITWTTSPAVSPTEVNNEFIAEWGYMFSANPGDDLTINGVTFTRVMPGGGVGGMPAANAMTPGFERMGADSYAEFSDEFYLGSDAELNQLLDGLTWGGNTQFQLNGLSPGESYIVQLFSSDDRATWIDRTLDIDSSWATPDGSRQLENIDYTAGGAWVDPEGRSKVFTGRFTADAATQEIQALIDGSAGQIDLNAVQLRIIPEAAVGILMGLAGLLGILRRRR